MEFWIDLINANNQRIGDGPITEALSWDFTSRLDRIGVGSFRVPATAARVSNIDVNVEAHCIVVVNNDPALVGAIVIKKIAHEIDTNGEIVIRVEGDGLMRRLADSSVEFLEIHNNGAGVTLGTAITNILDKSKTGTWGRVISGGSASDSVYARFAGESVFSALRRLANRLGGHFTLHPSTPNSILWYPSGALDPDNDVVAATARYGTKTMAFTFSNQNVCHIESLSVSRNAQNIVTRIHPYGAGDGHARLSLQNSTRSIPSGFTLDKATNTLINDTAEATYGVIEKALSWKDIAPITNDTLNEQNAANALFDQAYNYLLRHNAPLTTYNLTLSRLEVVLYPGYTIRVIVDQYIDQNEVYSLDERLTVLEAKTSITNEGLRTTALKVASAAEWEEDDISMQASQMEQGQLMEAHPQITLAYSPVGPYRQRMDSSNPANFTVRIRSEVVGLNYAILRFKTAPLITNTASVAAAQSTTGTSASGGSSSPTSAGGQSHSHDMPITKIDPANLTSNHKAVYIHQSDHVLVYPTSTGGITDANVGNSGEQSHTHAVNIPDHDHDITIPAHSHTVTYGLFTDNEYPEGIGIKIDGIDRTAQLGGPWNAGGNSSVEQELNITRYLTTNLRQLHNIQFYCASQKGEIEVGVDMLLTVQAIVFT